MGRILASPTDFTNCTIDREQQNTLPLKQADQIQVLHVRTPVTIKIGEIHV